tara:strand:- start:373 stop:567 length:195 start_codon:yes stop_codon:yes gene_type:complete
MFSRDYSEIAQAIYEVEHWDDEALMDHTLVIVRSISDVMFNDNPTRFSEDKFADHALNGVEYDD